MTPRTATGDTEAVERGAAALCRFIFPGYLVPRVEMARAVLAAAADDGEDWLDRLPTKHIAVGDGPARPSESTVPDEVVKAVREAMRETYSSIFGNSHDEPAEREYDMAEHVATAAQIALRKEWDEERNEAAVRQARIGLSWQRRALAAEAARARDAEALTTATDALRSIAAQENCTYWHKKVLKWCAREARAALAAIDHAPQPDHGGSDLDFADVQAAREAGVA